MAEGPQRKPYHKFNRAPPSSQRPLLALSDLCEGRLCVIFSLLLLFDFPPTPPLLFLHANHQPSMAPRQSPHRPHHSRRPQTHRIPHPLHLRRPSPRPRKISLHRPHHARLDDRFPSIHASRPTRRSHARPPPRRNQRIPQSHFQKRRQSLRPHRPPGILSPCRRGEGCLSETSQHPVPLRHQFPEPSRHQRPHRLF